MKAKILKTIKGLKQNEIYSMAGLGEIYYQGRPTRSALVLKPTKDGSKNITIEVPLEWVELISDMEGGEENGTTKLRR